MSDATNTAAHFPDRCPLALLLIDLINDLDFSGGQALFENLKPRVDNIVALKRAAKQHHVPVIYANDNFGRWRSDFRQAVQRCLEADSPARLLVERLAPESDDYFVLKPKYSAFFGTSLELLLDYLEVETLILTGISGDMCLLFTANDAYMRGYRLLVPADCSASINADEHAKALRYMERVLKADTRPAAAVAAWLPEALRAGSA